jgi:hypothetical protein
MSVRAMSNVGTSRRLGVKPVNSVIAEDKRSAMTISSGTV